MAKKKQKIAVGEQVMAYGIVHTVTAIDDKTITEKDGTERKVQVVTCEDTAGLADRQAAREEFCEKRDALEAERGDLSQNEIARRIDELKEVDKRCMAMLGRLGLRADLLGWWPEREIWAADGRLLNEAQKDKWCEVMGMGYGNRPQNPPWSNEFKDGQLVNDATRERKVVDYLESQGITNYDPPEVAGGATGG